MGMYRVQGVIKSDNLDTRITIDMCVSARSSATAVCHVLMAYEDRGYRYPVFTIEPVVESLCKKEVEEEIA